MNNQDLSQPPTAPQPPTASKQPDTSEQSAAAYSTTPPELPASPSTSVTSKETQNPAPSKPHKVTRLSDADLKIVRNSLIDSPDLEGGKTIKFHHSAIYPPLGLPDGLYKDVVRSRVVAQYQFLLTSFVFNVSLILQVLLGATLTALGSKSLQHTAVTVLAAANTVVAGILALMHNSGVPQRFQNDWNEFDKVEIFIRGLIDTGIVEEGWNRDQVISDCFHRYSTAKDTISKNKPMSYVFTSSTP